MKERKGLPGELERDALAAFTMLLNTGSTTEIINLAGKKARAKYEGQIEPGPMSTDEKSAYAAYLKIYSKYRDMRAGHMSGDRICGIMEIALRECE